MPQQKPTIVDAKEVQPIIVSPDMVSTEPPGVDPRMAALMTEAKARLPQPQFLREREAAQVRNPILKAIVGAGFGPQNIEENVRRGLSNVGEGLLSMPKMLLAPPKGGVELAAATVPGGLQAKRLSEGAVDWVRGLGEQAGEGDVGGTLARFGTEFLGGEAVGRGTMGAAAGVRVANRGIISKTQKGLGIDAPTVAQKVAAREAEIQKIFEGHKQQVFENLLQRGESIAKTKAANAKALAEAQASHARETAKIQGQNEARWAKQQAEYQTATAAQKQIMESRARLTGERDTLNMALRDNLRATDNALAENIRESYGTVRSEVDRILGPEPGNSTPILEAVRGARQGLEAVPKPELMGKIENVTRGETLADASVFKGGGVGARQGGGVPVKEFLERFSGDAAQIEGLLGEMADLPTLQAPRLSWQTMQNMYTALGDAMYGGTSIPGYRFRALGSVREAVGREMQTVAGRAGVLQELRRGQSLHALRDSMLRDTSKPISQGGSPLARIRLAEDPAYVGAHLRNTAARSKGMMNALKEFGADPKLIDEIIMREGNLKALPKGQREIKQPVRSDRPLPEFEAPQPKEPKLPEPPLRPNRPAGFDVEAYKQKQIQDAIARLERQNRITMHTSAIGLAKKSVAFGKKQFLKSKSVQRALKEQK